MTSPALLLGLAAPTAAGAAEHALVWSPALPAALVVVIGLVIGGAAVYEALRRGRGWGMLTLRLIAVGLLSAALLGPTRLEPGPDASQKPSAAFLVDRSLSMTLEDQPTPRGGGECSRIEALRRTWLEPGTLERLGEVADLQLLGFDERLAPMTMGQALTDEAAGEQTRLASCVADALGGRGGSTPLSDVVILSDGIDTDRGGLESLAGQARAAGVRVHAVVVGRNRQPADIALNASIDSTMVYDGQPTVLHVRLRQSGFDGRAARVKVREIVGGAGEQADGDTGTSRLVFDEVVVLERTNELPVPITPRRGTASGEGGGVELVEYAAEVEAQTGEKDSTNNARRTFVHVTGDRIKVCLFENELYWDTRFFIAALRRDPQVELTTVIGLGALRNGERIDPRVHVTRYVPAAVGSTEERVAEVPLREEQLAAFDVVVLGRGVEAFFPGAAAERLVNFVGEGGGSLILLRGRPVTGGDASAVDADRLLGALSPVEWGRNVLRGGRLGRTEMGRREAALDFERLGPSDAVLSELPGMIASTQIEREKAISLVWLRQSEAESAAPGADEPAAVAQMNFGRGRVLAVLTDGLWRWSFLPPLLDDFGTVYDLFWARALRAMALGGDFLPGQSVSLTTSAVKAAPGETVSIVARVRYGENPDFEPALSLIEPGGATRALTAERSASDAGRYTAAVTPTEQGVYTAVLNAPGMTPERLVTRFAVYDERVEFLDTAARPEVMRELAEVTGGALHAVDGVAGFIDHLAREAAARARVLTARPAWDRGWVFALVLALLASEWFWRRRVGLP